LAISKEIAPDPNDDALLAGSELGGKRSKNDKGWMENYETLKAYQRNNGRDSFPPQSSKLGSWVNNQRTRKREKKWTLSDSIFWILLDFGGTERSIGIRTTRGGWKIMKH
jgi:hypothetical protein